LFCMVPPMKLLQPTLGSKVEIPMTHTPDRQSANTPPSSQLREIAVQSALGTLSLASWDVDRVLDIAKQVSPAPSTATPVPGWHFGRASDESGEFRTLREEIWKYFGGRHEAALVMEWYEGIRVHVYFGSDLSWALFVDGHFEPNQFAFLGSVLRRGMTFVDVGANDGLYGLFAAKRVGPTGTVVGMEPSLREYTRLNQNLLLNQFNQIRSVRAAAWRDDGEMTLRVAEDAHAGHNTLGQFVYKTAVVSDEVVRTVRLDTLTGELGVEQVDVVKIDAEGAETAVVQGAAKLIERDHPVLLMEVSDSQLRTLGSSQHELLGLIRGWGYELYTFDETSGRPVRAERPSALDPNILAIHPRRREMTAE
jgi:FkbM family methyltransferase